MVGRVDAPIRVYVVTGGILGSTCHNFRLFFRTLLRAQPQFLPTRQRHRHPASPAPPPTQAARQPPPAGASEDNESGMAGRRGLDARLGRLMCPGCTTTPKGY